MTDETKDEGETNLYRWTPAMFEQAKAEARDMTIERLPHFIADCMRRCERDDQAVGAMVLAGLAACTASVRLRKKKPHGELIALGALMLYKEIMNLPGPFRMIAYEQMLRPETQKHFASQVDWQAAQWLQEQARFRLETTNPDPNTKAWLAKIALGQLPYGWTIEKPPFPDGFNPVGRRR